MSARDKNLLVQAGLEVRDLSGELVDRSGAIQGQNKALKNDKRFIFQAANHVQRAVDYLHDCQPLIEEEDEVAA